MNFLSDFGVQPILLAAQVVNFLILLFILKKFLYGPILNVLEKRKKTIEQSLKNAEEIERRLLKTEEDRERILLRAAEDSQKMLDETKKEIALMKEESRAQTQQHSEAILRKGQEALKMEQDRMMSEARSRLLDLAIVLFHKVTGKAITKDDQKKIFEQEIKHLS